MRRTENVESRSVKHQGLQIFRLSFLCGIIQWWSRVPLLWLRHQNANRLLPRCRTLHAQDPSAPNPRNTVSFSQPQPLGVADSAWED